MNMMGLFFPTFNENHGMIFRVSTTLGPAIALILLAVFLPANITKPINAFAWVTSNVLLAYSAAVLVLFLGAYFYFFDPRATTGGRLIFQFMLSLVGIISLNIIGIFVNPTGNTAWFTYPDGVEPWRPTVRLIIYGFVAYAVTSLAILLVLRKWFPNKVKKASDIPLKVRTSEIDVITEDPKDPEAPPPVVMEEPKPILGREYPPTDLIEETWPNKRGQN